MSEDRIQAEARKIADSLLPATAADREAALELAQGGDVIRWAKEYVKPYLKGFMDRVVRDGVRGGRNTEQSFQLMAWLALGYSPKGGEVNVFLDRLGASEQDARRAIDTVARVENLDEPQAAEVCARFLKGYLARRPQERERVWSLLGVRAMEGTE